MLLYRDALTTPRGVRAGSRLATCVGSWAMCVPPRPALGSPSGDTDDFGPVASVGTLVYPLPARQMDRGECGLASQAWRDRYFVLRPTTLLYSFGSPADDEPLGCVDVEGFERCDCVVIRGVGARATGPSPTAMRRAASRPAALPASSSLDASIQASCGAAASLPHEARGHSVGSSDANDDHRTNGADDEHGHVAGCDPSPGGQGPAKGSAAATHRTADDAAGQIVLELRRPGGRVLRLGPARRQLATLTAVSPFRSARAAAADADAFLLVVESLRSHATPCDAARAVGDPADCRRPTPPGTSASSTRRTERSVPR
mmetsp:Transcript_15049/g.60433  ORF Transcript_15049/g.60433 Transcript_15049/m.60433 type:complete len:316 (+) Transcript_15049:100-1047(+)